MLISVLSANTLNPIYHGGRGQNLAYPTDIANNNVFFALETFFLLFDFNFKGVTQFLAKKGIQKIFGDPPSPHPKVGQDIASIRSRATIP